MPCVPSYALRTQGQCLRSSTSRPMRSYPLSHLKSKAVEDSVMHDVRVRPAYRGGSSPYKRDARVPKKGLHFSPLLCVLASFSVPVLTRSPGHFAQVPKVDFTPEIPENPEKNPFPKTKLCPVSISLSSNFQVSSYPLINLLNVL